MNTLEHSGGPRRPGFNLTAQLVLAVWLMLSPFAVGDAIDAALWNTLLAAVAMIVSGTGNETRRTRFRRDDSRSLKRNFKDTIRT